MPTLQAAIVKSLPTGLALPDEIAAALEWMDTNKCVGTVTRTGEPYGVIDPGDLTDEGERQISLAPVEPEYVRGWVKVEGAVSRLAPIIRTGGDGSYAALWRDDNDVTQIVHMGSGSGSVLVGVMTRTPLDFLRLLAIGYDELCWEEEFAVPPPPARRPTAFRTWVTSTYRTKIPERASDIVLPMSSFDAVSPSDPFAQWLARAR